MQKNALMLKYKFAKIDVLQNCFCFRVNLIFIFVFAFRNKTKHAKQIANLVSAKVGKRILTWIACAHALRTSRTNLSRSMKISIKHTFPVFLISAGCSNEEEEYIYKILLIFLIKICIFCFCLCFCYVFTIKIC